MRVPGLFAAALVVGAAHSAEVESRQLTRYLPQDDLEAAVRKEGWTEVSLPVKGGVRKGDTVRVWTGGLIDRGNGDQPGENCNDPTGVTPAGGTALALSDDTSHAYAVLWKTESSGPTRSLPPGKPLELRVTKDNEKLWLGFNDERGRFLDNHLGKGRRHELDPLWVRIEVVRTIVD